jgi:predicted aspartyl protease
MTLIRMHSVRCSAQVFRRVLLLLPLALLSAINIRAVYAQSHNADGIFLVDARVNGSPAVLALDTGAEHSLLDRAFAQRLDLHSVAHADLQTPYSSKMSRLYSCLTLTFNPFIAAV